MAGAAAHSLISICVFFIASDITAQLHIFAPKTFT
jgi:hypothetical protein